MVKLIQYEDRKIPLRISHLALKMVKEETGRSISSMTDDDYESYEILFFYAIQSGYNARKETNPISREEASNILDEVFFEFLNLIPEFFTKIIPKSIEGVEDKTEKK